MEDSEAREVDRSTPSSVPPRVDERHSGHKRKQRPVAWVRTWGGVVVLGALVVIGIAAVASWRSSRPLLDILPADTIAVLRSSDPEIVSFMLNIADVSDEERALFERMMDAQAFVLLPIAGERHLLAVFSSEGEHTPVVGSEVSVRGRYLFVRSAGVPRPFSSSPGILRGEGTSRRSLREVLRLSMDAAREIEKENVLVVRPNAMSPDLASFTERIVFRPPDIVFLTWEETPEDVRVSIHVPTGAQSFPAELRLPQIAPHSPHLLLHVGARTLPDAEAYSLAAFLTRLTQRSVSFPIDVLQEEVLVVVREDALAMIFVPADRVRDDLRTWLLGMVAEVVGETVVERSPLGTFRHRQPATPTLESVEGRGWRGVAARGVAAGEDLYLVSHGEDILILSSDPDLLSELIDGLRGESGISGGVSLEDTVSGETDARTIARWIFSVPQILQGPLGGLGTDRLPTSLDVLAASVDIVRGNVEVVPTGIHISVVVSRVDPGQEN